MFLESVAPETFLWETNSADRTGAGRAEGKERDGERERARGRIYVGGAGLHQLKWRLEVFVYVLDV